MTDLQSFVQSQLDAPVPTFGPEPDWLSGLRRRGSSAFAAAGWPTKRMEAWKYSDLRSLLKVPYEHSTSVAATIDRAPGMLADEATAARLVFVDGQYRPALSDTSALPAGVTVFDFGTAVTERAALLDDTVGTIADVDSDPLVALNAALTSSGVVVHVGRDVIVDRPIEIVSITGISPTAPAWHPRNLFCIDDGAAIDVIEHHAGPGEVPTFANTVTEVRIGDNARFRHYRHLAEGPEAAHIAAIHAVLGRDAFYEAFTLTTGAVLTRTDARVRLQGSGSTCRFSGAYLLDGHRHCDNTSVIELAAPHTDCRQVFKGVLDDQSRGVFQGRIVVQPNAQKVDGHQLSRAILLSDEAEVDQKPELEIWADDVKCSHGATIGELDHNALFYMRARGVPEATARRLLIEAFLAEAFEEVGRDDVRSAMTAAVAAWMGARRKETA